MLQQFNRNDYAKGIADCVTAIGTLLRAIPLTTATLTRMNCRTKLCSATKTMKRFLPLIFILLSLGGYAQIDKYVPARPSPASLVNDFAGTLTEEQKQSWTETVRHDDSTSNQVAVVVIQTVGEYPD